MELVVGSLLLIVLLIITEGSEVSDIVRALRVDTLVDIEVLATLDLEKCALAVRTALLESGDNRHSESGEKSQSESSNKNQSPGLCLLN